MIRLIQRGDPAAASPDQADWVPAVMAHRLTHTCDECGSPFYVSASQMASLCPECAHYLYGTPLCEHEFVAGRCTSCGWNGAESAFVSGIRTAQQRSIRTPHG
jgi:predicted RNA-binding Zn-ribbon protein involved in translation (DUF1610 family)